MYESREPKAQDGQQHWLLVLSRPLISPPTRTFEKCRIRKTRGMQCDARKMPPVYATDIAARDIYGYHRAHSKDISIGCKDGPHSAGLASTAGDLERAMPALPWGGDDAVDGGEPTSPAPSLSRLMSAL